MFYSVYQMSEMTSLRQWLAWINYNHGTTEYRGIFHGTYHGAKSVVPRNTIILLCHMRYYIINIIINMQGPIPWHPQTMTSTNHDGHNHDGHNHDIHNHDGHKPWRPQPWRPQTMTMTATAMKTWTRKLCYRKDDRAMRPIHGCPEKFRDSLTPTATIPNIVHGLLFRSTL